jgi:alkylhydroperoxidase family enzyme
MSRIAPLPLDRIDDAELRDLIGLVEAAGAPGSAFARILAHDPDRAKTTLRVLLMVYTEGDLDLRLKEILRVQLARFVDEPYSASLRSQPARAAGLTEAALDAGSGDYETSDLFSPAEKAALRYADQMYLDSSKVDAAMYDDLREYYTEAQIMQLGAYISLCHGVHLFLRTLNMSAADAR